MSQSSLNYVWGFAPYPRTKYELLLTSLSFPKCQEVAVSEECLEN